MAKQNLCDLCDAPVDKPGHPVFRAGDIQIEVILRNVSAKSGIVHDTCPACLAKLFAEAKLPPPAAPALQGAKAPAP